MKKVILTILFLVLSGITAYFIIYKKGTTLSKSDKLFALIDSKNVDRIEISEREERLVLQKGHEYWSINNKEARTDLVNALLGVSAGLDAIAPVSRSQKDSVMDQMKTGTTVSFFEGTSLINTFTLCKWNNTLYAVRKDSDNPYRITLRGFSNIDLTKMYVVEENYWLTNILINLGPDNIKLIKIDYPANPAMGFELLNAGQEGYTISDNARKKGLSDTDPEIISEYLYFFSNIRFYPVNDSALIKKEVIGSRKPFFHLKIKSFDDAEIDILGYTKRDYKSNQNDPSMFYAVNNKGNVMSLKYNDFDPILVHSEYFLKK